MLCAIIIRLSALDTFRHVDLPYKTLNCSKIVSGWKFAVGDCAYWSHVYYHRKTIYAYDAINKETTKSVHSRYMYSRSMTCKLLWNMHI